MELMGAIIGLEALKYPCRVTLWTDSRYVIDGIQNGWAQHWRARGWRKTKNPDLWERLLSVCDRHDVTFDWVPGHNGVPENERCDALATAAALSGNLMPDDGYRPGGHDETPTTVTVPKPGAKI